MHSFVNKATGQDEAVIYITFQFYAGKLYDLQPISTDDLSLYLNMTHIPAVSQYSHLPYSSQSTDNFQPINRLNRLKLFASFIDCHRPVCPKLPAITLASYHILHPPLPFPLLHSQGCSHWSGWSGFNQATSLAAQQFLQFLSITQHWKIVRFI